MRRFRYLYRMPPHEDWLRPSLKALVAERRIIGFRRPGLERGQTVSLQK